MQAAWPRLTVWEVSKSAVHGSVLDKSGQRAPAQLCHDGVRVLVVPDQSHGLLERPSGSSLPFEVIDAKCLAEDRSGIAVEEMPSGNEIEGRIGRTEPAGIEHPDQTLSLHQQVRRNEILVAHCLGPRRGKHAKAFSYAAQAHDIEQVFALFEADLHPGVVIGQLSASTGTRKVPPLQVDLAQRADQVSKVAREIE